MQKGSISYTSLGSKSYRKVVGVLPVFYRGGIYVYMYIYIYMCTHVHLSVMTICGYMLSHLSFGTSSSAEAASDNPQNIAKLYVWNHRGPTAFLSAYVCVYTYVYIYVYMRVYKYINR